MVWWLASLGSVWLPFAAYLIYYTLKLGPRLDILCKGTRSLCSVNVDNVISPVGMYRAPPDVTLRSRPLHGVQGYGRVRQDFCVHGEIWCFAAAL